MGIWARQLSILFAATALSCVATGGALAADSKGKPIDFTLRSEQTSVTTPGKTLKWDARRGRVGLTLNLEQPETRASTLNDVQAGAYYRITPSLRIGGSVAFGDQELRGAKKLTPDESQPRVRLETAFKF